MARPRKLAIPLESEAKDFLTGRQSLIREANLKDVMVSIFVASYMTSNPHLPLSEMKKAARDIVNDLLEV